MRPLLFFTAVADRFALTNFFSRDVNDEDVWNHPQIEPRQYVQILEDFLMLCIHIVTDQSGITGWTQDRHTRKHIIQTLGLGPLMFSELAKRLPERSTESSIIPFLLELADFKEPTETASGTYSLKAEYFDQIDPFWHHYSRNETRRIIDVITDHRKKQNSEDVLIKPPPIEHPNPVGPWYNMHHWMSDRIAHEIIHYVIAHCGPIAKPSAFPGLAFVRTEESMPTFDLLLDLALQLIMIILSYDASTFSLCSVQSHPISGALSTFQQLWLMQTTEAFKPWKVKVDYIMSIIIENIPEDYIREYRHEEELRKQAEAAKPKPDARNAAASRQKQIMADFAKKQASFAAALLDDEDDMEEDESDAVPEETYGSCIVCQEDVTPSHTGGMLALFQPSRVMRECVPDRDWFEESVLTPSSLDQATRYHRFGMGSSGEPESTDGYPAANHRFGVIISACTHLMHESCMAHYFDATRYRHTQQVQRHHPENAARYEYLCPLCKSIGNMLIPLDSTITRLKSPIMPAGRAFNLSDKIREVSSEGLLKIRESAKIWDHHVETGELVPWFSDCAFHLVSLDPSFRREVKTTAKMIERFRSLVRPLSEQSQRLRNRKTHMYVPDDIIAYTVSTTEIALRGLPTPGQTVAEQVPETSIKLIKRLIGLMQLELDLYFGPRWDRTALRVGLFARFLPDWYRASTLPSPLLLRNPLALVVETAAIAPDLLQAVIHMAFFAEITRTMLGMNMWIKRALGLKTPAQPRSSPPADLGLAAALAIFRDFRPIMVRLLRNNAGPFTETEYALSLISDENLAKVMYSHTLPFLRRCAIIFYAVAGQYPQPDPSITPGSACEYTRLLRLLAIPEPVPILNNPQSTETPVVARWLNQWAMQGRVVPQLEFPGTYELARLPQKWEHIMIRYATRKCDVCETLPTYPAVCLFCGDLVCLAGDCCAEGEQGECNIHMRS
jgi:E3 ubiquitin-protein ligase UBR1